MTKGRSLLVTFLALGCGGVGPPAHRPAAPTPAPAAQAPPEVAAVVSEVAPASVKAHVEKLVSFGTRHTLSDASSRTRGIGAAREWIKEELERYAARSGRDGDLAMRVSFDAHVLAPDGARVPRATELVNVVAELPGAMPEARGRRYYVVGHYDSRTNDVMDAAGDAPGANDDASGVAVVLEAARVMSKRRYDATIVFLATAGEEQGLYGAKLHAKAAREAGLDVRGVLNNDIVGDPSSPAGANHRGTMRVFSEGLPAGAGVDIAEVRKLAAESDSASRQIARFAAEIAALDGLAMRPTMIQRPDRFMRGGDHLAFNDAGFPAIRFTTTAETYDRQHDKRDTAEFVDGDYLADVARLNVATLAHLANAPAPPADARIVIGELGQDVLIRWTAALEPDAAGYDVVWRSTTSPAWEHARDVGNVVEARLPLSKDDFFFGVRAYDKAGYRSPVAFARAAPK